MLDPHPTRAAALEAVERFLPRVPAYPAERGFDRGDHSTVSRLSVWLRHRVIHDTEVIDRVLARWPLTSAEKFLQEVVWRSYWRGWLAHHPAVWTNFRRAVEAQRGIELPGLRAAGEGATALTFFNDWVRELTTTGYLHNHTRMWFASVWIFTLKLPWALGADFMCRHLLDGDPASNTLSWRWVAGLHTRGKHYVARPDNIAHFSAGRWCPRAEELAVDPTPLAEPGLVTPEAWQPAPQLPPEAATWPLLLTDDALQPAGTGERPLLLLESDISDRSGPVQRWIGALRDEAVHRLGALRLRTAEECVRHLGAAGGVVIPRPRVGGVDLSEFEGGLAANGRRVMYLEDPWDTATTPKAGRGFFPFWNAMRRRLERWSGG